MLQVLSIAPKLNVTICCFLIAECRSSTGVIQRLNSSYVFKPGMTHRRAKSFPYKPAAIVSSTFAEVLFLDCDSYATRDPEELFLTDPMYLKFGALFFPDGYKVGNIHLFGMFSIRLSYQMNMNSIVQRFWLINEEFGMVCT